MRTYTLGVRKSINAYVIPSLLVYHGRGKESKKHDIIEDWICLKGNLQRKVKVRYYIHGEGRLMYNGKEMKKYKYGEVREHSMWTKESK